MKDDSRRAPSPRRHPWWLLAALAIAASLLPATVRGAGWEWLPEGTLHPRALADPREPAARLAVDSGRDRLDAALGMPLPLLAGNPGNTRVTAVLEVASFFVLGREGSFFPLRTFDGLFGLGLEGARGPWRVKVRAFHISAHKADGDSTIAWPGDTYSREFLDLEGGVLWSDWFAYARLGAPWHAVPADSGPQAALGLQWTPRRSGPSPFAAVHLSGDRERAWRVGTSALAGLAFPGNTSFKVAFRYFHGLSPEGQYRLQPLDQWGFLIRFGP